jgi:erythromycin esterase-like protein
MNGAGMVNIGQLAREQYGTKNVYLAGFGSYAGSVIAGDAWGAPMQEMEVPEAREGSIEQHLHQQYGHNGYLLMKDKMDANFRQQIPHRAIGVVYHPERERYGNYVPSVMAQRYDAFLFIDETTALHPLGFREKGQRMPDTYPFGY